jgi:hypothetical protein
MEAALTDLNSSLNQALTSLKRERASKTALEIIIGVLVVAWGLDAIGVF